MKTIRVIRGLILAMVSAAMAFPVLAAEPTVSVTAQQRYPWNGMVDVAFTITGESGTKYDTSFVARDVAGGTNLTMKTIYKSDGSTAALTNQLAAGSYKWVWNAAADLPDGFNCERVKVDVNTTAHQGLYMVIDLSGGSSATSYPVSYLDAVPSGGWTDVYKTTKLVLRRIESGTCVVTVSQPYYIGVFEVTQKQCALITGWATSQFSGDKRPVDTISYDAICVIDGNFMSKLQARTGLNFDLPTQVQWEYACRAGTTTTYSYGNAANGAYMWYSSNSSSCTHEVGTRTANPWGLYDMHGNVWEWCLDWDLSRWWRQGLRGGGWTHAAELCTSSITMEGEHDVAYNNYGFRVVMNVSN